MVDYTVLRDYILGSLTLEFMLAFYIFSILGMLTSMLLHYDKKRKKEQKADNKLKFDFWFWLKDNMIRALTNIIAIFIVMRFYDDLPINIDLNMFLGLVIGMSIDVVIIFLRRYTIINVFQAKTKSAK